MNKNTLEAQNPAPEAKPEASGNFNASAFLSCVKPLMSAEAHAQAEAFFASCENLKLNPEQVQGMAALPFKASAPATEKPAPEARTDRQAEMLDALRESHSAGVPSGKTELTAAQMLMAAIDKRGA